MNTTKALLSLTLLLILCNIQFSIALSQSELELQLDNKTPMPIPVDTPYDVNKLNQILAMINESLLYEYLKTLVDLAPRMTGTYGCEQAAEYIYQVFKEEGLESRYQRWTAFGNRHNPRLFSGRNVEGTITGPNTSSHLILFTAHYDTVRNTPGANDDGSGTAAVLAAASILSNFEFKHQLGFVTFSGEEMGLLGSHAYAKEAYHRGDDIYMTLQADMIGHTEAPEYGHLIGLSATEDVQWVFELTDIVNRECNLDFTIRQSQVNRDGHAWSDHFSFIEYGYEGIGCYQGGPDPNMHQPGDTLENVNFSYLVNTTKILVGTLALLADCDELYPQVQIESPRYDTLYFEGFTIRNISDLNIVAIDDIWIWADIHYSNAPVTWAEFYLDDKLVLTDYEPPFKMLFDKRSFRKHRITIIAYDLYGRKSVDFRDIIFFNILLKR